MRLRKTLAAAGLAGLLLFGCDKNSNITEPPEIEPPVEQEDTDPKLSEKTKILGDSTLKNITSYNAQTGTVVLSRQNSETDSVSVGDILVGGISEETPNGFLRKVTSVSINQDTIRTGQASLEETVENGSLKITQRLTVSSSPSYINLSQSNLPDFEGQGSVRLVDGGSDFDFGIEMEEVILYDADGNPDTKDDQISVDGFLYFNNDLALDFEIKKFKLKRFLFQNTTSNEFELNFNAGEDVPDFEHEVGIPLPSEILQPVIFYMPATPPLPVIVKPNLHINIGMSGDIPKVEVDISQEASFTAGISYDGRWDDFSEFNSEFDSDLSVSSNASLRGFAGPQLNFLLYGVIGPSIGVNGTTRLEADVTANPWWQLYGGLEARLGLKAKVFASTISDHSEEVISTETMIAEADGEKEKISEKILFVSERGLNKEIYVMNTDGSSLINLTNHSANDGEASWSPDGKKVAFISNRNQSFDIYTMNPNGSGELNISNTPTINELHPSWSPDGRTILFYVKGANNDIFFMNPNGSDRRKLDLPSGIYRNPRWSPDGNQIIFSLGPGGRQRSDIYVARIDGTELQRLTNNTRSDFPSWSPDGSRIAYASDESGVYDIFLMDPDGSNKVNITNTPKIHERQPSWSPDGTEIVYVLGKSKDSEIYIMDRGGLNIRRLTNNDYDDDTPTWSSLQR